MFEAALLPSKEKIMEENMSYLNSNKWENDTMYKSANIFEILQNRVTNLKKAFYWKLSGNHVLPSNHCLDFANILEKFKLRCDVLQQEKFCK